MQITKFVHSCLLVETSDRTALFDPGSMSREALDINKLDRLDDIFITHAHGDHLDLDLMKQLVTKFPKVHITGPKEVVDQLAKNGIKAADQPSAGVTFFNSPHENVQPLYPQPQEIGIHYLGAISHPGDSHSFTETKAILALPVNAPWGTAINALKLALELKPRYVLPIHDWHWNDMARADTYNNFERILAEHDIVFFKLQTGVPINIDL